MPITFRKSFRILPGVRLNINKRSWSITSGGRKGPKRTTSSTGRMDDLDGSARPVRLAQDHDQASGPLTRGWGRFASGVRPNGRTPLAGTGPSGQDEERVAPCGPSAGAPRMADPNRSLISHMR